MLLKEFYDLHYYDQKILSININIYFDYEKAKYDPDSDQNKK